MRPDPTSLALFVRIAETRSITKAAHACHIALAAASRRVSQLEDQFNVQLLYRTAIDSTGQTVLALLRAKLTAVTLPAARVVATRVKKRNVSGSTGWLAIFGSMSRTKSRTARVWTAQRARILKPVPRSPHSREPR